MCSSYGGCDITITGKGLVVDKIESYDITISGSPCLVSEESTITDTELTCFLDQTSTTHLITNKAIEKGISNTICKFIICI